MQINDNIMKVLYTVLAGAVISGLVYGADAHIDTRVQQAIDNFQVQQIQQDLTYFVYKREMAPDSMTADDKIKEKVLKRQLEELKGK